MAVKAMIARFPWISVAIVVVAFAFRVAWLDIKPAHFDEGVNGWFVDEMTRQGFYHYDPTNFHGPLHFYVLFLAQTLFGRSITVLRMPIVLVSTVCVAMMLAFRRFLDERACQIAAAAMAVSPAMVFYGRYAIHETWLLFFLLVTSWGLVGFWHFGRRQYLWALALGATGLILTKETYIIHFAAFLLAIPCLLVYEIFVPSAPVTEDVRGEPAPIDPLAASSADSADGAPTLSAKTSRWSAFWSMGSKINTQELAAMGTVCFGLILFFYTGGFLDWSSLPGLWQTFETWVQTGIAHKSGHEKEWYYWVQLIGQYEWPAAVGLVAGYWLVLPRTPRIGRYLAIYGLGALIGYSIVPYKTPWCIISLIWPFFFVFGLVTVRAARWLDPWTVGVAAAVVWLGSLGVSWKLNFQDYTDENEPYVYVQTLPDIDKLIVPLRQLAQQNPVNYQLRGHIILGEDYPFSWLLADYPRIDYTNADELPETLDADFLLVDDEHVEQIEPLLRLDYFKTPLRVRGSSSSSATLYLCCQTFAGFVPADYPIFRASDERPTNTTKPSDAAPAPGTPVAPTPAPAEGATPNSASPSPAAKPPATTPAPTTDAP